MTSSRTTRTPFSTPHMENNTDNYSAGTKRSWEGLPLHNDGKSQRFSSTTMVESASFDVLSMFGGFRDELDQHHDRRERLIKISRDITALSKKMYAAIYSPLHLLTS